MKTIAFLHGWGMHAGVFRELCDELSRDFAIWAPDLPGYAGAPACEPYTLEQLVAAVSRNAPERAHVVGWSLGAQVALLWAKKRPQQVDRLALIAATPCFMQRDDWPSAMKPSVLETFSRAVAEDIRGALQRFLSLQAQGDEAAKHVAKTLRTIVGARPLPELAVLEHGLRLLRDVDLRGVLSEVRQQTLVIHGDRDELVPLAAGQYLARSVPNGVLQTIPRSAHAPFVSNGQAIARLLAEHFDE
jgi:pimeloyl-[acyl-carrier protein] methyl ester esterase